MKLLPNIVINFHAVYDTKWMSDVLLLIKKNYNVIPISELEKYYFDYHRLKNACHITFDDGDVSFYKTVFPLLKKYEIPVSIYVSPMAARERKNFWFQEIRGYDFESLRKIAIKYFKDSIETVDKVPLNSLLKSLAVDTIWEIIREYQKETGTETKEPMNMNEKQLKDLDGSGLVSIGAHTINHPILSNETDEKSKNEIEDSIKRLEDILDRKIRYFAYPNGAPGLDFGDREIIFLKEAGIKLAFSTENKSFSLKDNRLSLPRGGLSKGNMNFVMAKLVMGSKWKMVKRLVKGKQESEHRVRMNG